MATAAVTNLTNVRHNTELADAVVFVKEIRRPSPREPGDEIIIVVNSRNANVRPIDPTIVRPSSGTGGGSEIETVSVKHGIWLIIDYLHNRFSCGVHKFTPGTSARLYCENCFCYVCDEPVARCKEWDIHCQATDKPSMFRSLRMDFRNRRNVREIIRNNATVIVSRGFGDTAYMNNRSQHEYALSRYSSSMRNESLRALGSESVSTSQRTGTALRYKARRNSQNREHISDSTRSAPRQRRY